MLHSLLEVHRKDPFPCSFRWKILLSIWRPHFLAGWGPFPAFRGYLDSLAHDLFAPSSRPAVQVKTLILDYLLLLNIISHTPVFFSSTSRVHIINWPIWIIHDNLPISKVITLITSEKIHFIIKVMIFRELRIRTWTSLGSHYSVDHKPPIH